MLTHKKKHSVKHLCYHVTVIPAFQYGIKKFVLEHILVSQASLLFFICPIIFYLAREVTATLWRCLMFTQAICEFQRPKLNPMSCLTFSTVMSSDIACLPTPWLCMYTSNDRVQNHGRGYSLSASGSKGFCTKLCPDQNHFANWDRVLATGTL